MEFISTKDMTNEQAPSGMVLVQYLEPFFGAFSVEFGMAYFDNPKDYEDESQGEGWKHWNTENPINVLAYCELPKTMHTTLTQLSQVDFKAKYGTYHPNLGNIGASNL